MTPETGAEDDDQQRAGDADPRRETDCGAGIIEAKPGVLGQPEDLGEQAHIGGLEQEQGCQRGNKQGPPDGAGGNRALDAAYRVVV